MMKMYNEFEVSRDKGDFTGGWGWVGLAGWPGRRGLCCSCTCAAGSTAPGGL